MSGTNSDSQNAVRFFNIKLTPELAYRFSRFSSEKRGEGGITLPLVIQTVSGLLSPLTSQGLGEGGIRTLGSLLGYGALAKRCFQPLSHLTKIFYNSTLQPFLPAENWEL